MQIHLIEFSTTAIVAHLIGDYIAQSHWMATHKTKPGWGGLFACFAHVTTYGIVFALMTRPSVLALIVIIGSHYFIDAYRLARYVVFAKNLMAPADQRPKWPDASTTGYPSEAPPWLAFWLLIIADNLLHIICNALALTYL